MLTASPNPQGGLGHIHSVHAAHGKYTECTLDTLNLLYTNDGGDL